jgi:hypothetical protein
MKFDDPGIDDLPFDEKVAYIVKALDEAKTIVACAMQMIATGAMPKGQTQGWTMLNLLVRQKERELEKYLEDE